MPVFFCPENKLEKSGCSVYNLIMILKELCAYYETLLGISAIPDISLNGLQVGNTEAEIRTVAFAVDAAFETIEKAADADADLLKLVDAVDRSGFFPGLVQGRQQHRRQNRNDRYYYK